MACNSEGEEVGAITATKHTRGTFFLSVSIYIYIYFFYTDINSYRYMLWCYYLGQVGPAQGLLSGPSCYYLTPFVRKTLNIGASALFESCA